MIQQLSPDAQPDPTNNLAAKWFLNGFPKAGLHAVVSLIRPAVRLMPSGQLRDAPWVGTFRDNSWSDKRQDTYIQLYHLSGVQPGHFFKSHCAWSKEVETFMWYCGIAHVFIYRDLRDVAVSTAYHILSDNPALKHPGREEFLALGGFDEVLMATIGGLGRWPGVIERWETFAPWLAVPWVLHVRFEELVADPAGQARRLLEYGFLRLGGIFNVHLRMEPDLMDDAASKMAESMLAHRGALTFRKGVPGSWKEHFTPAHSALFKEHDRAHWLIRLGYSPDDNW